MDHSYISESYKSSKEKCLYGRYITLNHIHPILSDLSSQITYQQIGSSEFDKPIYEFNLGKGTKKILIWTQMHGNESTGTKAVFDFFKYIGCINDDYVNTILSTCRIKVIPILNPDGAELYTRTNGNDVDLNRDAVNRRAIESNVLRNSLDTFKPDFCFNLHDQRTIFGVSGTKNPATISFLAPSEEVTRSVTKGRKKTMNIIIAMNKVLQQLIPGHVGRYTDEFYPGATGDNFQKLGYPTILIESGHYPNDYDREEVRKYKFACLVKGIHHIASQEDFSSYEDYFTIPDNEKNFYDILHIHANGKNEAFQYKEVLKKGEIIFIPEKVKNNISNHFFHKEIVFADGKC